MISSDNENVRSRIAVDFYNDTYLSDQNACTSPRVIVWTGKKKEEAKKKFWNSVYDVVNEKYHFQSIQGVDKLSTKYIAEALNPGQMKSLKETDNRLVRVQVSRIKPELMEYRGNSGYFYEYDCEDILEIRDFCDNTHCQTIGLIGDKSIVSPLFVSGIHGVDRVVPVGHTMDFDFIWDGYNLVERLTRNIII